MCDFFTAQSFANSQSLPCETARMILPNLPNGQGGDPGGRVAGLRWLDLEERRQGAQLTRGPGTGDGRHLFPFD